MEFTADQVWGLAVRADTFNGGYVKYEEYDHETRTKVKDTNKTLLKKWLFENLIPTEEEVDQGRAYRDYFKTYTFRALKGKLSYFDSVALKLSSKETFTGRDLYEFAVISCLPSVARRSKERDDVKRDIYFSDQLEGSEGEFIVTEVEVISCSFNTNYMKYRVLARAGDSFVDFWFGKEVNGNIKIRGKIKKHRDDKTTSINYVKICA